MHHNHYNNMANKQVMAVNIIQKNYTLFDYVLVTVILIAADFVFAQQTSK